VRQTSAALSPTSAQNCAAGTGGHTLHKTVHAGAVTLLWLVRSFWHTAFTLPHPGVLGQI